MHQPKHIKYQSVDAIIKRHIENESILKIHFLFTKHYLWHVLSKREMYGEVHYHILEILKREMYRDV